MRSLHPGPAPGARHCSKRRGGRTCGALPAWVALWLVLPVAAGAQPGPEVWHLEAAGATSRLSAQQEEGPIRARFGGSVPARMRLGAGVLIRDALHLDAALFYDRFRSTGPALDGSTHSVAMTTSSLQLGGEGRFRVAPTLTVIAGLGYEWGQSPILDATARQIEAGALRYHGPRLAFAGLWEPGAGVGVRLGLDAMLLPLRQTDRPFGGVRTTRVGLQLQTLLGRFPVGGLHVSPVLDYALDAVRGEGGMTYAATAHRVGVGLRLLQVRTPRAQEELPRVPPHGRLFGRVRLPEGAPAAGAQVEVAGQRLVSDAQGAFSLPELPPGPVQVVVTLDGFEPGRGEVEVVAGEAARLELSLSPLSGPGIVAGVVRVLDEAGKPGAAAQGAKVVAGTVEVVTDERGEFRLEEVGPGPVELRILLAGHKSATEVVAVPAGRTVEVALGLEPLAVKSPASLRGVIRSARGRASGATVKVVESGKLVRVGKDGRFQMSLAGGTYTVIIDAPGHVSQRRVVRLGDGEHAIFHVELKPETR